MEKAPTKALVILSGGQDSTTALFWAKLKFDEVHAITFDYGQRHFIEIQAAIKVAGMAGVNSHKIVSVPGILESSSPLTSSNELEKYENAEQMEKVIGGRVELTFVPMRNPFFFILAMNRAVALGCDNLVTGICQEDIPGRIRADGESCSRDFRYRRQPSIPDSCPFDEFQQS
jgi:7-cyano-7-deazaguanine synthase